MYTGQTLCYSFVGKGNLGLERVARHSCAYLLYVVDIEIYSSCSILEDIRDPGTESTLDHTDKSPPAQVSQQISEMFQLEQAGPN